MRDLEVMKFVKYVSAAAPGSRWDVTAEYAVIIGEDENDEVEEDNDDEAPQLTNLENDCDSLSLNMSLKFKVMS